MPRPVRSPSRSLLRPAHERAMASRPGTGRSHATGSGATGSEAGDDGEGEEAPARGVRVRGPRSRRPQARLRARLPARLTPPARCVRAREPDAQAPAWPPLYAVLYSIDDHATREYFPLELGNADYAARILRAAAHVLRETYRQIREHDLTPPCLEEGRIVEPHDIDNKHLFAYLLSAQVPLVCAKLLKIEADSLAQVVRVLALGEADMLKPPLPRYWTALKVRRLFDAGLRVVQAAAEAGVCQWTALNLSSLRSQYKQHLAYRDERMATSFPHGALNPLEEEDESDEGWGAVEESSFWRPPSPVAVVQTKAGRARQQNEDLQRELAAAARTTFLQKVENWEAIFGKLPPMERSKVDDGTCERLRLAVQGRLTLMHHVKRTRESEALANRQKQYQEAKALRDQLDQNLLPKLRGLEEQVAALWKDVAPAELVDSAAAMERDAHSHAQDAANARDYVTARTLTEAEERLAEARRILRKRKEDANLMEEAASRFSTVFIMRQDVQELVSAATRLGTAGEMLNRDTQPPRELVGKAQQLDLSIQKWVHKWTTEKKQAQSSSGSSQAHSTPTSRASNSVPPSPSGSQSSDTSRIPEMDERILTPQEANDKQRLADIVSMRSLADDLAGALRRLRWREKICGFLQRAQAESNASLSIDPLHSDLQTLLEAAHGAAAQSISARIIGSAEDDLAVFRLMDDRQRLFEAAEQQAEAIGGNQHRQRKRWEAYEYTVLNNWFVRIIGSWGTGDLEFRDPCGVAIAPNGDFWVAGKDTVAATNVFFGFALPRAVCVAVLACQLTCYCRVDRPRQPSHTSSRRRWQGDQGHWFPRED